MQMGSGLKGKCDPSDIVQQSLMEAWRSAAAFRGSTEAERTAWLRQIVSHVLAHEIRRYRGTMKRDVGRELSIEKSLAQSSQRLSAVLASELTSPSQQVAKREQLVHLADKLEELPADYREVILLRNVEGLSHAEVAERMGRKEGAVRMLWVRALQSLREHFSAGQGDSFCS
jgi:RNA polymerase sigma-70 factor (ECF subfamily)